ncbi:hypothetical protein F2P81_006052 [Scophthalmus maximus]|uniref:Uncharacterized protein n=1 Tax=Scophthalmus maximus TaxID=52904 RepID=A0A6A4TFJ3_SCOMX|nr:hypothetical protein F2P81_006052 [Scophthalmus maximus]
MARAAAAGKTADVAAQCRKDTCLFQTSTDIYKDNAKLKVMYYECTCVQFQVAVVLYASSGESLLCPAAFFTFDRCQSIRRLSHGECLSDAILPIVLLFEEEEASPESERLRVMRRVRRQRRTQSQTDICIKERSKEKIKNTVSLKLNKNLAQGRYLGEQGVTAEDSFGKIIILRQCMLTLVTIISKEATDIFGDPSSYSNHRSRFDWDRPVFKLRVPCRDKYLVCNVCKRSAELKSPKYVVKGDPPQQKTKELAAALDTCIPGHYGPCSE